MRKRVLSLLMTLLLCFSMLPTAVFAVEDEAAQSVDTLASTGHEGHNYCGKSAAECHHTGESSFQYATPIDNAIELQAINAGGSYYLTDDIDLSSTWTPASGVVLCLNGKRLSLTNATGAVIHVERDRTFTLLDCGAGKITHSGSAGGQGVLADGTFYMYGGTITQNWGDDSRNDYAGGVYVSGTGSFHMLGGKITRNNFTDSRPNDPHISGVLVATGGTITLSRDADISDNGTMDDIYLCNDVKIAIGEGGLTGSNRSYIRLQYAPAYRSGETVEITYPTGTDVSGHFRGGGPGCIINERPSDHVVLVTAGQDWGLKVTMTPKTLTLAQGTSGTLTAKPDCNTAHDRAYQWFQNTQDSIYGGGTAITTATTNKGWDFTVPDTLTPGTYYYYCTVSLYNSDGGIVQQENATAVVKVLGNLMVQRGADVTQPYGTEGGKVTLDITGAEGYTLYYQWYQNDEEAGTGAPISGATGAEYPIPADTPIGTYYYYCKVTAAELSEPFTTSPSKVTITKGTLPLTVSTGWVYGGTVPQPSVTGLPAGVTVDQATVTYTDAKDNVITPDSTTPVGDYHVKVEYTDSNADYSGEADFKVTPILVDKSRVEITNTHTTYDGTTKYAWEVITVTVEVNGKTIPLSSEDFHTGGVTAALGVETPGYRGVLTLQGNYAIVGNEQVDFTWYIDPLEAQLELVNADGRKYGDGLGEVTMRVANAVSGIGGNVTVRYTGGDDLSVGGHNVTATKLVTKYDGENKNYKLPDESNKRTLTYRVAKGDAPAEKRLSMDVYNNTAKTYTYDFTKELPTNLTLGNYSYSGSLGSRETNWIVDEGRDVNFQNGVLSFTTGKWTSQSDNFILWYEVTVTSDNYNDFKLYLAAYPKDKPQFPVPESDITMAGWTYGQTPTMPSVKGLPAGVTPTFTYQDATGTDITPTYTTDAGAYTVTVRAETDDTVYTGTKPFTIAPKVLTADDIREYGPISPNKVYDGNTGFDLTGLGTKRTSLVGTPGANDVLYIGGTAAFAGANAGNTELIFTTNGKLGTFPGGAVKPGNYTIAKGLTKSYTARIDQRPIDFTVDSVSKRFGSPDSTADVRVTFTSVSGNNKSGLVDGETLEQGVDYDVTATFSQATIGEDKNVVVTVTLKNTAKARNYALLNGSTNATGTITKAAAPNVPEQTVEIYSNAVTQYPIDLTKGWPAGKPSISDDYTYDGRYNPELNAGELSELLYQSASFTCPAPDDWNGTGTIYLNINRAFTADVGADLGVLKLTFKSPNYDDVTLCIRFKVKAKAQKTLAVNLEGWTYGETANPPAYTVPAGATETTLAYTSRDGRTDYGSTPPTDAGDYTLTVRCEGIDTVWTGTADFTIAKKQIAPPAADPTSFTYTSSAQTYTLASNAAYTISPNTTQTNTGSYTITVSLNDTANTEWTDGTTAAKEYTFTISAAKLTVTALDKRITAGQSAPDLTTPVLGEDYKVDGLLGQDALTAVTLAYGETPDTSKAGSYAINISAVQTNYDITTVPGTLTVAPRPSSGGSTTYPVNTPSKTENGSVSVSPKNASKGDTVTITVKPDSGYELETITAIDKNGNDLKLTDKGDGKYSFVMPAGKVDIKATFMEDNSLLNFFYDVPNDAYYYEAVRWAVGKGITEGVGNNLFAPNQPCTRAQIVTFLWRAAGSPEPKNMSSFSDVPADSYYAKAVAWAVENDITTGTGDGKFSPDATCTRAQAVTFLFRASEASGVGVPAFSDVSANAYYAEAVKWATDNGITNGIGGNLFGSNNDCTRAQIVTFLWRLYTGE